MVETSEQTVVKLKSDSPNKYTWEQYKFMLSQPFENKLWSSKMLIRARCAQYGDKIFVAWSGGKDSTAVLYLALQENPNIPVVFCNTGVEMPETIEYVRKLTKEWNLNFYETKPIKTFWQCVKEYGYPRTRGEIDPKTGTSRGTPLCCFYLKEKPVAKLLKEKGFEAQFTGLTAAESYTRRRLIVQYGYCYLTKRNMPYPIRKIHPIAFWKQEEVLKFLKDNNVPLNSAYKKVDRVGCIPCTSHLRWRERLAKLYPKLYDKISTEKTGQTTLIRFGLTFEPSQTASRQRAG